MPNSNNQRAPKGFISGEGPSVDLRSESVSPDTHLSRRAAFSQALRMGIGAWTIPTLLVAMSGCEAGSGRDLETDPRIKYALQLQRLTGHVAGYHSEIYFAKTNKGNWETLGVLAGYPANATFQRVDADTWRLSGNLAGYPADAAFNKVDADTWRVTGRLAGFPADAAFKKVDADTWKLLGRLAGYPADAAIVLNQGRSWKIIGRFAGYDLNATLETKT